MEVPFSDGAKKPSVTYNAARHNFRFKLTLVVNETPDVFSSACESCWNSSSPSLEL
jgi:hypothetical protein